MSTCNSSAVDGRDKSIAEDSRPSASLWPQRSQVESVLEKDTQGPALVSECMPGLVHLHTHTYIQRVHMCTHTHTQTQGKMEEKLLNSAAILLKLFKNLSGQR